MSKSVFYLIAVLTVLGGCESDSDSTATAPSTSSLLQASTSSSFILAARVPSATVCADVRSVFRPGDFALVPVNTSVSSAIAVAQHIVADKPGVHIVFFDRIG